MELSARKRAVLSAIVRAYIETGEPVGSKNLTALLENAPSSATLRNEMSELCSLGLLQQPHTSAGRIPTSSGFHFYVNSLMQPTVLGSGVRSFLDGAIADSCCEPEQLPFRAAETLSDLTGFAAVVSRSVDSRITVRQTDLIPLGSHSAMLLLVTSDGRVRSRICRLSEQLSDAVMNRFHEIVRQRILRTPVGGMDKAYLQNVIVSAGMDSFALMPLFTVLFEMADDAATSTVKIMGANRLFAVCGEENTGRILALSDRQTALLRLLSAQQGSGVIFGNETPFAELTPTAIAVADYFNRNGCCGKIGVIGPDRMAYDQIIPSIEYMAQRLSEQIIAAEKDMED